MKRPDVDELLALIPHDSESSGCGDEEDPLQLFLEECVTTRCVPIREQLVQIFTEDHDGRSPDLEDLRYLRMAFYEVLLAGLLAADDVGGSEEQREVRYLEALLHECVKDDGMPSERSLIEAFRLDHDRLPREVELTGLVRIFRSALGRADVMEIPTVPLDGVDEREFVSWKSL